MYITYNRFFKFSICRFNEWRFSYEMRREFCGQSVVTATIKKETGNSYGENIKGVKI